MSSTSAEIKLLHADLHTEQESEPQRKSIWVSSLSNFSVQYNFSVVAIALKVMASDYEQTSWIKQLLKATVFAGAITGQLVMGYVGDLLGRNKAMAITIALAGIGALASALFAWGDDWAVYGIIAASRFILGVGVGGVYPLSATKAAEESETMDLQKRNLRVSLAFFWQTPGAIAPYIVTLILIFIVPSDEAQWRILFAVGAIPSVFILYGSLGTADSVEFRRNKGEISTWSLLQEKSNWHKLLGTGGCWLIYDVVYYGTNLFSPTIVGKIFGEGDDIKKEAWQNIVVQSAGIPALALGIWCQQRYGTKPLQFWGFLFIAVCFLILGILFEPLKDQPKSLFTLYIILLFSLNFGANITTFILPAEVYPSHVRSTMNGISAALGKVGAIIGTIIYQPIYDQFGITTLMCVAAVFALGGVVLTHFTIHPPKEIHNITQLTQPEAERELKDTEEADQMLT